MDGNLAGPGIADLFEYRAKGASIACRMKTKARWTWPASSREPNLTATLLKLGNSSYYNPSNQKVNTITRAIILLGAETIRELTLACSFIESILSSSNKARANEEIAQAIHAAVQARELAIAAHDVSPEEVFIAALLHNLGSIAFWCSDSRQSEQSIPDRKPRTQS